MNVLFLHQNFPGQFVHLGPAMAAAGHQVRALALNERPVGPGVTRTLYRIDRRQGQGVHPLLQEAEVKVIRGEAALNAMLALQREGFEPDLVIANPAWGEALFVKDLWPRARLVCLLEFFYNAEGADLGFDPEFAPLDLAVRVKVRLKNMALLEAMRSMDLGVAPTAWQRAQLPPEYRARVEVAFDGIDTDRVRPDPQAQLTLADGTVLRHGDPILSFVNRNFEPYRGYHVLMRALPAVLEQQPQAHVVLVGADGVSYGAPAPHGQTWKQIFLDELRQRHPNTDLSRVHFAGQLPYADYLRVLQVSAAHVYLTYPFVLSWSCIEALAAGCHVIGSRTAPVEEFISDGINGTLVDFFDVQGLANAIVRVLRAAPGADHALRQCARDTAVARCDLRRVCLPRYGALLSELMSGD